MDKPGTSKSAVVKRKAEQLAYLKGMNGAVKKEEAQEGSESKKPKSVQEDPSKSKVFKSLFTSSSEGKQQPRAHWVTYNPFYN